MKPPRMIHLYKLVDPVLGGSMLSTLLSSIVLLALPSKIHLTNFWQYRDTNPVRLDEEQKRYLSAKRSLPSPQVDPFLDLLCSDEPFHGSRSTSTTSTSAPRPRSWRTWPSRARSVRQNLGAARNDETRTLRNITGRRKCRTRLRNTIWWDIKRTFLTPRSNGLVVRVVACEARGPGFDSSSDQMVFSLLGYRG